MQPIIWCPFLPKRRRSVPSPAPQPAIELPKLTSWSVKLPRRKLIIVQARTKSEARAQVKTSLKLDRLPPRTQIAKV